MTAGAQLAARVKALGVQTIFSLAGAGHTHFLLPLRVLGVRIVGTRHETGAVGAADGYARASGQIGIAAIIAEQGLPNAISALATAHQHGTPMVILVTRFPDSWVEAAGEYAVDHHSLVEPVCKWVRTVPSPNKLVEYFDTACRIAHSGRPGPTVLVIPQDFLAKQTTTPSKTEMADQASPPKIDPTRLEEAADLLVQAKSPAILVDTGVLDADRNGAVASKSLVELNSRFGLPIFTYGSARGLVPENQADVLPWPYAQRSLPEIDVLLVAGTRLNMWFGFGRAPRFPKGMQVIQFDTDPAEIGRNAPVALGAAGDCAAGLAGLADILERRQSGSFSAQWLNQSLSARKSAVEELTKRKGDAIHALSLLGALEKARPEQGIFVGDGADILNWAHAHIRIKRKRGYMDHHPLGSMGMALPLALGAAAAERDLAQSENREPRRTTFLTGDGSIGFYIAELDTIMRENLPITIVVGNDGQWGTEVHGQSLMTGQTVNTEIGVGNYAQIAKGFGWNSFTVNRQDDISDVLEQAFEGLSPTLVDVRIDPDAGAALKTNPELSFLIFSDLVPPDE